MLEYYEVNPLPEVCVMCLANTGGDDDCYNCDYALDRWHLTPDSEAQINKFLFEKRKNKFQRKTI